MIERNEFRVGPTRLEGRAARWSLRGWKPLSNTYAATELDGERLEGAFKALHAGSHGRPRKRCLTLIDDSLVRYAMVPSFNEARSVREYEEGARLRCETLLGWSRDRWTIRAALPPRSGHVLCCGYHTTDAEEWSAASRTTGDRDPIIVPGSIAAINEHCAHLKDDGWVVVISAASCVAVLMRERAPASVHQIGISGERRWRDDDLQQWLASLSALVEPAADASVHYLIDARSWKSGSRLSESLDNVP